MSASAAQLPFANRPGTAIIGRTRQYRLHDGNVRSCCKAEVDWEPGDGKLPPETFRLVSPNITKHLTAGIRSETEVQKTS
jgi:hypothetical protein